jgi:chemotaxis protein methyltransferase CheR
MSPEIDDFTFKKIRDLINSTSGINFTEINRPILESRLKERLRQLQKSSIAEYYDILIKNEPEQKELLDLVTTNLTKFFRNIEHFNALEKTVLPDLKQKKENKTLRVWSAGCSTGEEPYTTAMVLHENLEPGWKVEILASDISFNSLVKAKEGFYTADRIVGIPEKYMKKYMVMIGNGYYIKDDIKKMIQFDYHNLKNRGGQSNFDIIFCRNVIIYFDKEAQERTINNFYNVMNDYGYLFIGHSESLFGMNTKFVFTKSDETCYYVKKEGKFVGK